jgi:hypothetical protein
MHTSPLDYKSFIFNELINILIQKPSTGAADEGTPLTRKSPPESSAVANLAIGTLLTMSVIPTGGGLQLPAAAEGPAFLHVKTTRLPRSSPSFGLGRVSETSRQRATR